MAQNPFNKGTDHCIWHIQGVQEKLCFFLIHCNPSLAYIAVRETFKALNGLRAYSHS